MTCRIFKSTANPKIINLNKIIILKKYKGLNFHPLLTVHFLIIKLIIKTRMFLMKLIKIKTLKRESKTRPFVMLPIVVRINKNPIKPTIYSLEIEVACLTVKI